MAVLDRNELEQSPLADLHAIASELGIEGYRRLRRDDLIEALLSGEVPASSDASRDDDSDSDDNGGRTRSRRGGRGRGGGGGSGRRKRDEDDGGGDDEAPSRSRSRSRSRDDDDDDADSRGGRSRSRSGRGRGGGRSRDDERDSGRGRDDAGERDDEEDEDVEEVERKGVLDILPNGSGFLRGDVFHHADDDVYVSPAQIRRCELRSGDEIAGPVRPPRRSERHPSLVRVDKVNEAEPEPPAERPRFEDLVPVFATSKLPGPDGLDVPYGRGSRVAIGGAPGSGVTSLLRDVVDKLKGVDDLDLVVVLAGVRPEEVTEWKRLDGVTVAGGGFDRSVDEQAQIADMAIERAKRIVERGGHAAVVIDTLEALPPGVARRVFGAARSVEDGGSLTVIAATSLAGEPQRVATTRIVLEPGRTVAGESSTLRAELLA